MLDDEIVARSRALPEKPEAVVLSGTHVELRPLDPEAHGDALYAVSCGAACSLGDRRVEAYDADALIWKWMHAGPYESASALRADLVKQVATRNALPMVVLDAATHAPVGTAAFMANRPWDLTIELGAIWYSPLVQRTGASREATRMMLAHAFGLGYRRVEWKCNARNERSRRAALSYGFTFEGIQEHHMIVKGHSRDTAWFRMLDHEWRTM